MNNTSNGKPVRIP